MVTNDQGIRYVNVNTETVAGLDHVKQLRLVHSGLVDVIKTHLLNDASIIFEPHLSLRGRSFALFHHPVCNEVFIFYCLQETEAEVAAMTLLDYARSDRLQDNWMVHVLTNEAKNPITMPHIEVAKDIVRRKVMVGITEILEKSLIRFEKYFGWWETVSTDTNILRCQKNHLTRINNSYFEYIMVDSGSEEYDEIARRNWADIQLYHYAKKLFLEQSVLV